MSGGSHAYDHDVNFYLCFTGNSGNRRARWSWAAISITSQADDSRWPAEPFKLSVNFFLRGHGVSYEFPEKL